MAAENNPSFWQQLKAVETQKKQDDLRRIKPQMDKLSAESQAAADRYIKIFEATQRFQKIFEDLKENAVSGNAVSVEIAIQPMEGLVSLKWGDKLFPNAEEESLIMSYRSQSHWPLISRFNPKYPNEILAADHKQISARIYELPQTKNDTFLGVAIIHGNSYYGRRDFSTLPLPIGFEPEHLSEPLIRAVGNPDYIKTWLKRGNRYL